jgi:torulene dioxygenase
VETDSGTTFKVGHWFDGFTQVHRFQILPPDVDHDRVRVIYNSRCSTDGLIEEARKTGRTDTITFGRKYDPCQSYFQKVMTFFKPFRWRLNDKANNVNVGVTISANHPGIAAPKTSSPSKQSLGVTTLCNKTDASGYQLLNPQTLEPIGFTVQSKLHPNLKGPLSATHAKSDPFTGDVYNYNLEFGRYGTYRIFRASASTSNVSILATIPNADPAYLHSLFLSPNYVILCVWNSFFTSYGIKLIWERNIVDSLTDYDASKPAKWYIVDRCPPDEGGKGHIATYDSPPFFAFHSVNAYEVPSPSNPGSTDILADILTYDSLDILKRFYLENLLSDSPSAAEFACPKGDATRPIFRRFRLPSIPTTPTSEPMTASIEFSLPNHSSPELPSINPNFITSPHRYVYGILDKCHSTFFDSLLKLDLRTRTVKSWSCHAHSPGEPVFVSAHPIRQQTADEEDEGVLMCVVLDGKKNRSYLLVLNARTMEEVGRAECRGVVGFGFHGTFVRETAVEGRVGRGLEY